jgi:FkbM family methyltransferase
MAVERVFHPGDVFAAWLGDITSHYGISLRLQSLAKKECRLSRFNDAVLTKIKQSLGNSHQSNWDFDERGPEPSQSGYPALRKIAAPIRRRIARLIAPVRRVWTDGIRPIVSDAIRMLLPMRQYRLNVKQFDGVDYLYDRLEDARSKELLVELFAYRMAGHRKIKLARNDEIFWSNIKKIEALPTVGDPIKITYMDASLPLRTLNKIDFFMEVYCTARGAASVFLQRQYELHRDGVVCKAEFDDVAIDAGGCWGDTALYFSHQVGPDGRVIAFEFIPSNLDVLDQNLAANSRLSQSVTVIRKPLWSEAGRILFYVDWGPGSRCSFEKMRDDFPDTKTETTTIDDTVEALNLKRLDFIKMDIEGAELPALTGAERSLKEFHPKLAISLYHSVDDFRNIPRYLDSLGLKYKFYLDHHTIYENETVLFCVPESAKLEQDLEPAAD